MKPNSLVTTAVVFVTALTSFSQTRREIALDNNWQIRKLGEQKWIDVKVPGDFEEQIGIDFDGIAEYRTRLPKVAIRNHERLILHFDAVATEATVFFNGKTLGKHLGGWTPFRLDITDVYRTFDHDRDFLVVRVDEKVGHNTQGFLPIIAPHFGGIWQPVKLIVKQTVAIDDLRLMAIGDVYKKRILLSFPIAGADLIESARLVVKTRLRGDKKWNPAYLHTLNDLSIRAGMVDLEVPILGPNKRPGIPLLWFIHDPRLYEVEITLMTSSKDQRELVDAVSTRAAFRRIETRGKELLLNGKPVVIRGLLNWGYTGKSTSPSTDEKFMRAEIDLARDYGFNLMKFCLWMPPKRYLELCDEIGLLAWVEYPAWHPKFTPEFHDELMREYEEFFDYDRNHPSVVLRSLTCETGHGADLQVIQSLYNLCKKRIPGAVVEDDSSWISWQRVFDFYDDHPYGNNHTWPAKLEELKRYMATHGDKPIVLGEAIAADTWVDPTAMIYSLGSERPFWSPWFLDANKQLLETHGHKIRADAKRFLESDSKNYALLMRKYQMERYRRDLPKGGYVVSVIRDFPKAGMGLVDYAGKQKWKESDWSWHRDQMLTLITENDRRSFVAESTARFQIRMIGSPAEGGIERCEISAKLVNEGNLEFPIRKVMLTSSKLANAAPARFALFESDLPSVKLPHRVTLKVEARFFDGTRDRTIKSSWPMWVVPKPSYISKDLFWVHPSFDLVDELSQNLPKQKSQKPRPAKTQVVITRKLDVELIEFMEAGGRVFLMANNQPGSFPLRSHWFLRGGPLMGNNAINASLRRQVYTELQHFDLASDVIPKINYLDQIDPVLLLWDNHDLRETNIHALAFATNVGDGRLFVSAVKHDGKTNAIGSWLLNRWIEHTRKGKKPRFGLKPETIAAMKNRLTDQSIALWNREWKFAPDPNNDGLRRNCHKSNYDDQQWGKIRTDRHWEGQGHNNLDGWAWYRIQVDIPKNWDSKKYLNFTGVDDYYEVFINGEKAGSGGNIEKRQTAFEDRTSHDISRWIKSGQSNTVAVRVYDWYGAGGIFRPVTLSTSPLSCGPRLLK